MATLVAVGVTMTGERRIIGLEFAPGNDEEEPGLPSSVVSSSMAAAVTATWLSDAHRGVVAAVSRGAPWILLAEMSGPLHPQLLGPRASQCGEHGRLGQQEHLRAARRAICLRATRAGGRQLGTRFPAVAN